MSAAPGQKLYVYAIYADKQLNILFCLKGLQNTVVSFADLGLCILISSQGEKGSYTHLCNLMCCKYCIYLNHAMSQEAIQMNYD